MYRFFLLRYESSGRFCSHAVTSLLALLLCSGLVSVAQSTPSASKANSSFTIRATHLLGWPNTKTNRTGTLSLQDNALRFQQSGKPITQVEIASVRNVFLGDESVQVGGLPMKIGKAATPYGGGRVLSLFAHKKYDTMTVEYVDSKGGVHGAIFQLKKGQGELLENELVARGVSSSSGEVPAQQVTSEVTHEEK